MNNINETNFFEFYEIQNSVDLQTKEKFTKNIYKTVETKIFQIFEQMQNNTFPFDLYSFRKNPISGLTGIPGIYVFLNKKTKKLYLGSTGNLSQRKGEHSRDLSNENPKYKLLKVFVEDLQSGNNTDFVFVPLLGFQISSISVKQTDENIDRNQFFLSKKTFQTFLEFEIETPLLEYFLSSEFQEFFYNKKTTGTFLPNNQFGGSPQSGSASKSVKFENYAWESISSAAKTFKKDRKLIRNRVNQNGFSMISDEEFRNFSGLKIFNHQAETFFDSNPSELNRLRQSLNFR